MRRSLLLFLAAFALPGTAGCAPAGSFFLRVDAPLRVPADCDALRVEVRQGDATGAVQLDHTYDATRVTSFPLTLEVQLASTRNLAPQSLHVSTWALKGSALAASWAQGSGDIQVESHASPTLVLSLQP